MNYNFNIKVQLYLILITLIFFSPNFAKEKSSMIGTKAAPFSLFKISDNKYYRSKNIIGEKNIIISFFGTWCSPCRQEIPKLQKLSKQLGDENYEFLLICVSNIIPPGSSVPFKEKTPNIINFIKKLDVDIEVLFDKYNVVWRKYADLNKGAFPLTVVINKSGEISYHNHGYNDGDENILNKHLKTL